MDKKFSDLIPLVIFTSFMTVASGLMCGLTLMQLFEPEMIFSFENLHIISGITLFGFGASFFHLSKKLRAVRALFGMKKSWLSREIFFGSIFMFLLLLTFINEYLSLGIHLNILFSLAAITSLITVYCVGMVYNLDVQLSWKGSLNLLSPFVSATLIATTYYQSQMDSSYIPVILLLALDFYYFMKRYKLLLTKKNLTSFHFPHLIIPSIVYLQIRGIITFLLLPLLLILGFVPFYLPGILVVIDRITFYSSAIQINPEKGISRVRNKILEQAI